jgi:DNA-binding LytR/AlgR family response regulator
MINIVIMGNSSIQENILKLYIKEDSQNAKINYELLCFPNNSEDRKVNSTTKPIDLAFILISKDEEFCTINNIKMLIKLNPNIVNIYLSEDLMQNIKTLCFFRIFDFISLPIEERVFHKVFMRSINQILAIRCRRSNTYITFSSQNIKIRIPRSQILYLSRENGKTKIVTKGNTIYYSYESLKSFESKLFYGFQRISQDKIINMAEIIKVEKDILTLYSDFKAKITRSFKKTFYESFDQNIVL